MLEDLTVDEFGILLSLFAVLLLAFGVDFHLSRKDARKHRGAAMAFAIVSFVGELATGLALLLTWVALWSPRAWERIDTMLVFIPGTVAVCCALILTVERVVGQTRSIIKAARSDDDDDGDDAKQSAAGVVESEEDDD